MTFQVAATSVYTNSVTYSLASGTLPPGLALSTTGGISGIPSATDSGSYTFTVAAQDAYSNAGVNRTFVMNATARSLTWGTATNLGSYVQQTAIAIPLVTTSSLGNTVTYSVTSGSLPSGLTVSSSAIIGTMPVANTNTTYNFTVTASDGFLTNALNMTLYSVANSTVDLYAGYVTCLLHFDNGSYTDVIGHTVNPVGTPTITSNGVGLYNSSLYLNGSSALNIIAPADGAFIFGANDFTIECSVYFNTISGNQVFVESYATSTTASFYFQLFSSQLQFGYSTNGTTNTVTNAAWSPVIHTWYQLAAVRKGSNFYMFVNGTQVGTTYTTNLGTLFPVTTCQIGYYPAGNSQYLNGFIDEIRITNGFGRYTSSYTPGPFPNPPIAVAPIANAISALGGGSLNINPTTSYPSQPLNYSLSSGALPAGLILGNATGISGTLTNPSSTTNYTFVMNAVDTVGTVDSKTYTVSVLQATTPTWVTPSGSLGTQVQQTNFFAQLNAVANALTLTTSAATTSPGNTLTFSSTAGVVVGMTIIGPNLPASTVVSAFTSTTVTTSNIIPPTPISTTINFTPTPVTYAVTMGGLPPGLTMNTVTGVISGTLGTVSANTTTNFIVNATTVASQTVSQSFSITTQAVAAVDPYISNVVFESYFNNGGFGTGGTNFYDLAGHTVSAVVGKPILSTATSLTGGSSAYFNGSSGIKFAQNASEIALSNGNNFTIELGFNAQSLTGTQSLMGVWSNAWLLNVTSNAIQFPYSHNGSSNTTLSFSYSFSTNAWYQLAVVCNSNTVSCYVNGNVVGTANTITTLNASTGTLSIGYNGTSQYFTGYIDEVRITNGNARYTSNYTPSVVPFQPVFYPTPAGTLGTQVQGSTFGVYVVAQSQFEQPLTYFVYSGALPSGLSLDAPTGYISGILPTVANNVTSTFTIGASDGTGTALQTFSITTAANAVVDPLASLVVAEMHFDGVAGSTVFLDTLGHPTQPVALTGSGPTINNIIRQAGSGSMYLDGQQGFLYIGNAATTNNYAFDFSSGNDFTIEMSVYIPSSYSYNNGYDLLEQNAGFFILLYQGLISSSGVNNNTPGTVQYYFTPVINTWYQFAFVQSSGNFTVYVNGSALTLASSTSILVIPNTYVGYPLEIGRFYPPSPGYSSPFYVDEFRVTCGPSGSGAARYLTNYTPQVQPFNNPFAVPTLADPIANAVVLEMHFENANGTNAVSTVDNKGGTVSIGSGTPIISNAVVYAGNSSLFLNGSSSLDVTPLQPLWISNTTNLTIEAAVYGTSWGATNYIVGQWGTSGSYQFLFSIASGTSLQFLLSTNGTAVTTTASFPYTFATNTWYDVAVSKIGNVAYGFVNGVSIGTYGLPALTSPYPLATQPLVIGAGLTGYIDEVRLTYGLSRYNINYTSFVPASNSFGFYAPFPNSTSGVFSASTAFVGGSNTTVALATPFIASNAANVTYTNIGGNLANTLTLNANGVLTGTMPSTIGSNTFNLLANVAVSINDSNPLNPVPVVRTMPVYATNDPYANAVVLEMHFEGANGTTNFVDTKGHTVVVGAGSPVISTLTSYAGGSSLYLNGSASLYVKPFVAWATNQFKPTDFWFSNQSFTLECCFMLTGAISGALISQYGIGSNANVAQFEWIITNSTTFTCNFINNTTNGSTSTISQTITFTVPTLVVNTWYNVALSIVGTSAYLFVNGTPYNASAGLTYGTLFNPTGQYLSIGAVGVSYNTSYFTGFIDEIRVTNGIGRYSSAYTVFPTGVALPDTVAGMVLPYSNLGAASNSNVSIPMPFISSNPGSLTYTLIGTLANTLTLNANGIITGIMPSVPSYVGDTQISTMSVAISNSLNNVVPTVLPLTIWGTNDAYSNSVILEMHFESTVGSSTFVDAKGHTVSVGQGSPVISNATAFAGNSSLYLNGSSSIIIAPNNITDFAIYNLGFTIEISVLFTSSTTNQTLFAQWGTTNQTQFYWIMTNSTTFTVYFSSAGSTTATQTITFTTPTIILNQWYNFALVVLDGYHNVYMGVNGTAYVSSAILSYGSLFNPISQNFSIGAYGASYNTSYLTGYIDEVRFSKGINRNVLQFPQGLAFPDSVIGTPSLYAVLGGVGGTSNANVSIPIPFIAANSANVAYTLSASTLPSGLTLNSNGVITGTMPSTTGYSSTLLSTVNVLISDISPVNNVTQNLLPITLPVNIYSINDSAASTVVLEMHFEGANGTTNFVDTKGHSVTTTGSPVLSNATSYAGNTSLYLPGGASIQIAPLFTPSEFWFGNGYFALEMCVYLTSSTTTQTLLSNWTTVTNQTQFYWIITNSTTVTINFSSAGSTSPTQTINFTYSTGFNLNQWYNLSLNVYNNNVYMYVNGTSIGSTSVSYGTLFNPISAPITIGAYGAGYNTSPLVGYIDEVRISKGWARNTSRYQPYYPNPIGLAYPDSVKGLFNSFAGLPGVLSGGIGGTSNATVSIQIPFVAANAANVSYSLTGSTLPTGLTLNSNGVITGTMPSTTGYSSTLLSTVNVLISDISPANNVTQNLLPITQSVNIYNINDQYANAVVLEMHFEGANGTTSFVDTKGHTVSVGQNTPIISNTNSYAGKTSLYLNGSSSIQISSLQSPSEFWFGSGNFTIELCFYLTSSTTNQTLIGQWGVSANQTSWYWILTNSTTFTVFFSAAGAYPTATQSVTLTVPTILLNQWYNVALCINNSGSSVYMFVNGTGYNGSLSYGSLFNPISQNLSIGAWGASYNQNYLTGYIDEVRITKGIYRYGNYYHGYPQYPNPLGLAWPDSINGLFTNLTGFGGASNSAISIQLPFIAANAANVSYSLTASTLPSGLTLHSNGVITGNIPSVSSSNQITQISTFNVLISDISPVNNTNQNLLPITQPITLYGTNDQYANAVVLELHFEGANGTTNFVDTKGHSVAAYQGSPIISNATSYAGNTSLYLNGSSSIVITPQSLYPNDFWFSNQNFTLEMCFFLTSSTNTQTMMAQWGGTNQTQFYWILTNSTTFTVYFSAAGSTTATQTITFGSISPAINLNQWYNVALSQYNGTLYLFLNGTQIGSATTSYGTLFNSLLDLSIGAYGATYNSSYLTGYIDEVRITKGVGRYNSNYSISPQGLPLPDSVNGMFLPATVLASTSNSVVAIQTPFLAANAANVTYSLINSTLPTGLTLNANGVITGTMPSVTSSNPFTLLSTVNVQIVDTSPSNNTNHTLLPIIQSYPIYGTNDQYANAVVLEMHFEGANGSNAATTIDTKGHSVSVIGSPIISNTTSYAGNSSAYFNGSSYVLINPLLGNEFWFGNNNFTLECGFMLTSGTSLQTLIGHYQGAGLYQFNWIIVSSTSMVVYITANGTTNTQTLTFTIPTALVINQWYNAAFSVYNGTAYMFVNGTQIGSITTTYGTTFNPFTTPISIGANNNNNYLTGYIDEVRITNGIGRYNGNYSIAPQGMALPDSTKGLFSLARYYAADSAVSASMITPFVPASGDTMTYSVIGTLPSGLTMNSTTGVVSGTMPTATGNSTTLLGSITVSIADATSVPVVAAIPIYSLADTQFANVTSLFHFESANGSTTFIDTVTGASAAILTGTPYISNAVPTLYGQSCVYFNGSSGIQSNSAATAFNLGSGNWTIEFAMFITSGLPATTYIMGQWGTGAFGWNLVFSTTLDFNYALSSAPGTSVRITFGTFAPTPNAWATVAISKVGTSVYAFVNGVQSGSTGTIASGTINPSTAPFQMGYVSYLGSPFTGYIDEFRLTVGTGRYSSNYTPSVPPFPDVI